MITNQLPLLMTLKDICFHLRIERDAVLERISKGELQGVFKDKGKYRIKTEDLQKYIEKKQKESY